MCKNLSNVLSGQTGSHSPARIDDYSRYFTALSHDQNVCFILVNYYSVSLSLPLSGNSMTANKKSKKIEAKQHANTKSANQRVDQSKSSSEICHIRIIQLMSLVRFCFCLDFCLFSNVSINVYASTWNQYNFNDLQKIIWCNRSTYWNLYEARLKRNKTTTVFWAKGREKTGRLC